MPMLLVMNATAQASVASISGPTLDNRRVLAGLVDLGIVLAGTVVILFAADALSGDSGEIRGALGAVILGWALYYYFAMESGGGQTVGKKLMNLRVVLADGRPAGMREIAVRTVLRVIDGIGLYIVGLIVMMVTGERRQRLGDLAAGTIIVDASATPWAPPAPAFEPVEETAVEDEAVEPVEVEPVEVEPVAAIEDEVVEPVEDEVVEDEPVEPVEDEAVEPVHVELVEDEYVAPVSLVEPVEDEPVPALTVVENVEDEVTPDEPAVPLAIVEDEPVEDEAEEELPEVSSPSLEQLAHDVAAVRTEDEPAEEPMTLRSVETVSAIDLVMGAAEDESSEPDQAPEGPAAS
jgi:uncharacterized RDD family membrane protein YckC